MKKEDAVELMRKYAGEQQACFKYLEKGYDSTTYFEARKLGEKINKLRLEFFIPCVRTGRRYRYVFRPA